MRVEQAREAEEIHLGKYDHLITLHRDEFVPSILVQSGFARHLCVQGIRQADKKLFEREAHKRWDRVMMQVSTLLILLSWSK